MKKSPNPAIILPITVIILILFGTIAYLLYQNNQLKQTGQKIPLPLPTETINLSPTIASTPSLFPTVDPLVGWQTYSSQENCFSFKYPPEVAYQMQGDSAHLSIWGPTQKENTEFYDGLSLTFSPFSPPASLKDYVDSKFEESKQFADQVEPVTEIIINGINGYTYTNQGLGTFEYIYLQSQDSSCAVEIINGSVDPANQGYQQIVDQILSTLTL